MSHYVAQSGLKLLASSDPPALASQSSGITGVRPQCVLLMEATIAVPAPIAGLEGGGRCAWQCQGEPLVCVCCVPVIWIPPYIAI